MELFYMNSSKKFVVTKKNALIHFAINDKIDAEKFVITK